MAWHGNLNFKAARDEGNTHNMALECTRAGTLVNRARFSIISRHCSIHSMTIDALCGILSTNVEPPQYHQTCTVPICEFLLEINQKSSRGKIRLILKLHYLVIFHWTKSNTIVTTFNTQTYACWLRYFAWHLAQCVPVPRPAKSNKNCSWMFWVWAGGVGHRLPRFSKWLHRVRFQHHFYFLKCCL